MRDEGNAVRSERLQDDTDYETLSLMGELGLNFRHARSLLRKYGQQRAKLVEDARERSDWLSLAGD
jgi:hypothetical protein